MKIGVQTLLWGPTIGEFKAVLDTIAELGFSGVEIAQHPAFVNRVRLTISDIMRMTNERGLVLLGLSGGSLQDRMDFCEPCHPHYYCLDSIEELDEIRWPKIAQLAVQPFLLKGIRNLDDVNHILTSSPNLRFIPDTAHLFIAGDDPIDVLDRTRHRLAAVHLKDWDPSFGRSPFQYAKGFVPLGRGVVPVDRFVSRLREIEYDGWVVVEQDSPRSNAIRDDLRKSAEWLSARDCLKRTTASPVSNRVIEEHSQFANLSSLYSHLISRQANEPREFLQSIAESLHRFLNAKFATVWLVSERDWIMTLSGSSPSIAGLQSVLPLQDSLSSDAILKKAVVLHSEIQLDELTSKYPELRTIPKHVVESEQLPDILSIPVLNPRSPNNVWAVINLGIAKRFDFDEARESLADLSKICAQLLSACMDSSCLYATTRVNSQMSGSRTTKEFLDRLVTFIRGELLCASVEFYLAADSEQRFLLHHDNEAEPRDLSDDDIHIDQFKGGSILVRKNDSGLRQEEESSKHESGAHCLLSAIVDPLSSAPIGVVKCKNRYSNADSRVSMFDLMDVALLEAIVAAVAAPLINLMNADRQSKLMRGLVHELGKPIVATRGALEELCSDPTIKEAAIRSSGRDYLSDAVRWCRLSTRLLKRVALSNLDNSQALEVRLKPTGVVQDVIRPATRRLHDLFGDSSGRITFDIKSTELPKFNLDSELFQEVVLNLLENSIKYSRQGRPPEIKISSRRRNDGYSLLFSDFGIGVDPKLSERIFEEGFRGRQALSMDVTGQGLGLWYVRQIMEAHGGKARIASCSDPFTIELVLPNSAINN